MSTKVRRIYVLRLEEHEIAMLVEALFALAIERKDGGLSYRAGALAGKIQVQASKGVRS